MDYKNIYEEWCNNEYFDEATRAELKAIVGDEADEIVKSQMDRIAKMFGFKESWFA